jgi:hypothetical protein
MGQMDQDAEKRAIDFICVHPLNPWFNFGA